MAESANILTKLQDLLVYLIAQLNKFPRDQKFVLGDRIETKLLDVQEDCQRASPAQRMSTCGRAKKQILISFATAGLWLARTLRRLAPSRGPPPRPTHEYMRARQKANSYQFRDGRSVPGEDPSRLGSLAELPLPHSAFRTP